MARHIHVVKVHHLTLSFPTRKNPNPKPVLDDVDFGTDDGTFGDKRNANATGEVGTERGAIVATDVHGAKGRTNHQAAAKALGKKRR